MTVLISTHFKYMYNTFNKITYCNIIYIAISLSTLYHIAITSYLSSDGEKPSHLVYIIYDYKVIL